MWISEWKRFFLLTDLNQDYILCLTTEWPFYNPSNMCLRSDIYHCFLLTMASAKHGHRNSKKRPSQEAKRLKKPVVWFFNEFLKQDMQQCLYPSHKRRLFLRTKSSRIFLLPLSEIPGPGVTCGLSLLSVLIPAPRVFLRVLRFSSIHKNQHF